MTTKNDEAGTYPYQGAVTEDAISKKLFEYTNAERTALGLNTLEWDEELAKIAKARADECAELGYITHYLPKLQSPSDSLVIFNYQGCQSLVTYEEDGTPIYHGAVPSASENMDNGYYHDTQTIEENAKDCHNSYMNSSGHKANILRKGIIKIGIATVIQKEDDGWAKYNVELFLHDDN